MSPNPNSESTRLRPRAEALPVLTIPGTPAVLGRGSDADLTIDDDSVSDVHARLEHRDGQWWIVDLGSTNGTRVDGARIQAETPHPLEDGSEVRLGGFVATLEVGGEVVQAVPPVETVAPSRRGAPRIPVWAVLLLLLVIALLAILVLTLTGDPETVSGTVSVACALVEGAPGPARLAGAA